MHLLMLGTKLVLFWADTSEKLEKLKESSEGDFVASLKSSCTLGQSIVEFFLCIENCTFFSSQVRKNLRSSHSLS